MLHGTSWRYLHDYSERPQELWWLLTRLPCLRNTEMVWRLTYIYRSLNPFG